MRVSEIDRAEEEKREVTGTAVDTAPSTETAAVPATRSRSVIGVVLGLVIDTTVFAILTILSFATYLFVLLPGTADSHEERRSADLNEQWSGLGAIDLDSGQIAEPFDPYAFSDDYSSGDTFAKIRIPALGEDWEYTVSVGTSLDALRYSPGWYETTQLPGEPGNFATAAHRDGSNAPYMHMDRLDTCDDIIIETSGGMWIYTVLPTDPTSAEQQGRFAECAPNAAAGMSASAHYEGLFGKYIVSPTAIETIFPIPGGPLSSEFTVPEDAHPLMTMTSCHPRWQNSERIIVHAALERSHARE